MAVTAAPERAPLPLLARPLSVLILVSAAHGITHVYAALYPLIYPIIQREWGLSYALLGGMIGLVSLVGGLLQLVFGFAGRYAPRNVILGLGNLFFGVSVGLTGLATNFAQFTILRCVSAVANAPQHPVGNSMIADRFPRERRGHALAVNFAGGNVGTLIVPLLAVTLIGAVGWQGTMFVFAIPGIVVGLLLIMALDDRNRALPQQGPKLSNWGQLREVLANRNVVVLIGAASIAAGGRGLGVLLTFVPLYLINTLGYPPTTVGVLYTVMLLGSVAGPMLAGQASDRFGRKAVLLTSLTLSTVTTILLAASGTPPVPVLALLLFLMGAFVFVESPVIQSYMADSVASGKRDVLFGFYFAWVYAVGAIWLTAIGLVVDKLGFSSAWLLMAASYLGAALFVLQSREEARGL